MSGERAAKSKIPPSAASKVAAEPRKREASGKPAPVAAIGNLAAQAFFRPSSERGRKIGRPTDPEEREAESLASRALLAPIPDTPSAERKKSPSPPQVQGLGSATDLHPNLRAFYEPRLGRDLGDVRIHTGPEAGRAANALHARAFSIGSQIAFAPGRYVPDSSPGNRLLAHELAHITRGDSEVTIRTEPDPTAQQTVTPLQGTPVGPQKTNDPNAPVTKPEGQNEADPSSKSTIDPSTIDLRALSNADLITRNLEATDFIAKSAVSDAETEAWRQLQRELADERTRRIGLGFIFLAEQTDSSPAALYQMRSGSAVGTVEIVTADTAAAMGPPDISLGGGIMTLRQVRAYISTLGYQTVSGPSASEIIQTRQEIVERAMMADLRRPGTMPIQGGLGRRSFADVSLAGGYNPYGPGNGPGRLPLELGDGNFRGRVAEIGTGTDYRTGWGMGLRDYNKLPWTDVTGRSQMGNFPVLDFGAGSGAIPRILGIQPISVTSSGAADYAGRRNQYITKMEALLDVEGRRATPPAGVDLALQHVRQASGDPTLAAGTPSFQQAQSRYLPDTMFAVPDANVATLRNALSNPNAAPPGGTNRMIARGGGVQDLYAEALRASPIQITLRDGTTVTCSSLAELAARAPVRSSFSVPGSTISYPPDQRISTMEFSRALAELGKTAASRIVSISDAPAMAAAADAARLPKSGGSAPMETRILEIDSTDLGYISQRIGQGIADKRAPTALGSSMQWTTSAQSDPVLSAVRNLTGKPDLQRGTPEFEAARLEVLGNAKLAINADDVSALRAELGDESAWGGRLRSSFGAAMSDSPVAVSDPGGGTRLFRSPEELDAAKTSMTPEQYARARAQAQSLVADRVTGSGITTEQLVRLQKFRDDATDKLGDQANSALQPDVIAHVRLGSPLAAAESFGKGGLGGMIIGVVTTAGIMYIDSRQHPDWAKELAVAGAKDFAVSGSQSAAESQLTYYMAQRAISSGAPLSGLARFGARAGPAAIFAGGLEVYDISQEQREHSGVEVTSRVGRAVGIAVLSMEIGAAAGSIVPGPGTAAGAVVGFLVGAVAGGIAAYILENNVPGGAESWNAEAAANDARNAEALRQANAPRVEASFGETTSVTPVMSSADISNEEQAAIAQWATLLTIAQPELPPG